MNLKVNDKVICIKTYERFNVGQIFKIDDSTSMFYRSDKPSKFYKINNLWFIESENEEYSVNKYFETLNQNRLRKLNKLNNL